MPQLRAFCITRIGRARREPARVLQCQGCVCVAQVAVVVQPTGTE